MVDLGAPVGTNERMHWPVTVSQARRAAVEELARINHTPVDPFQTPVAFELSGTLDLGTLERTLQAVIEEQAALRVAFHPAGGLSSDERLATLNKLAQTGGVVQDLFTQRLLPGADLDLRVVDLKGMAPEERQTAAAQLMEEVCAPSFDLSVPPLMRTVLIRYGVTNHILAVVLHHIVSDRVSVRILERRVAQLYRQFVATGEVPCFKFEYHCGHFAEGQKTFLKSEAGERALAYWRDQWQRLPSAQAPGARTVRSIKSFNPG